VVVTLPVSGREATLLVMDIAGRQPEMLLWDTVTIQFSS
jgi:hypothetical protein